MVDKAIEEINNQRLFRIGDQLEAEMLRASQISLIGNYLTGAHLM